MGTQFVITSVESTKNYQKENYIGKNILQSFEDENEAKNVANSMESYDIWKFNPDEPKEYLTILIDRKYPEGVLKTDRRTPEEIDFFINNKSKRVGIGRTENDGHWSYNISFEPEYDYKLDDDNYILDSVQVWYGQTDITPSDFANYRDFSNWFQKEERKQSVDRMKEVLLLPKDDFIKLCKEKVDR